MKKLFLFLTVTSFLIICSCSEEKKELKIESLTAFAYDVDTTWELTATAVVSGFETEETDNNKSIRLSYYVDLVSPSGQLLEQVSDGLADETMDLDSENANIETQLWLDDEFETGNYKLIFHVTDDLSSSETKDTTDFVLE